MPKVMKRVLDVLTNNSSAPVLKSASGHSNSKKKESEFWENLTENQFQPCKIVRHGFPSKPSALAYDPVQKLLAIGCHTGSIRILGQPGVDCYITHDTDYPVIQLQFLANQGALVSVCADDTIHLWNLRQTKPAILHSLKFKKERITYCHIPHQSNWMYVGTEKGNIHLCNVETFTLSGYSISWNKAIELSQKSHPGHIVTVCENPVDENKLLISFSSGFVVLWDLKNKTPDHRYHCSHGIRHTCWHFEGKQFMCCHSNGSLTIWNCRNSTNPQQEQRPHAKNIDDTCHPMDKVAWLSCRNTDPFIVFSGGFSRSMPARPSITVMKGKSTTILEVDHCIIDFQAVTDTPWPTDFQDPTALVILTERELVVIDLEVPGYPSIELGHAMDIHDSPVTCLKYIPDPNTDLIPGLYQVAASKVHREESSKKEWPITGGEWSVDDCDGIPEIFVTGHADGSVRFWDASAVFLKAIYKLRTKKLFRKDDDCDNEEDDPFHITHIFLCPESRTLAVVNVSCCVTVYKLTTQETQSEISCLNISHVHESLGSTQNLTHASNGHGTTQASSLSHGEAKDEFVQHSEPDIDKTETDELQDSEIKRESNGSSSPSIQPASLLKAKSGIRQSPGFQAELVCLVLGTDLEPPSQITYLSMNTSYQLLAFGTTTSLCIVDMLQKTCLLNMSADALLMSIDKRIQPRSPNKHKSGPSESSQTFSFDQAVLKSPTDEGPDATTRVNDAKLKWGMVAKKSRLTRKSIGDYFAKPLSPLNFRRPSLKPKSVPVNLCSESQQKADYLSMISTPGVFSSPEEEISPGNFEDNDAFALSPPKPTTITFQLGEEETVDEKEDQEGKSKAELCNGNQNHPLQSPHHLTTSQKSLQREQSTSSMGSSCPSFQRIKKPQHRVFKKTQSFSFEKSLDSATSIDDSAFSRASSFSETDRATPREIVTSLTFACTYTKKNDNMSLPCVWVGTSGGYLFNVMISMPTNCDQRSTQLVVASPSGTVLQMKGGVTFCTFLNSAGQLISAEAGNWREQCSIGYTTGPSMRSESPDKDGHNQAVVDKQFMIVCSERQAKVFTLPSQVCMNVVSFNADVGQVMEATVDSIQGGTYLACYTSNGYILVYGLPSLNLLMESSYLPAQDVRIPNSFCFGVNALAIYLASQTEIQRISYSIETYESMQEVIGHLFIPRESPERPNPGFFKGLFGGGHARLDREELFGEGQSGRASRGVAQHIPGTGGSSLEGLRAASGGIGADMQRLRMQALERGEKLTELEEKTQRMHDSASKYSSDAHALMLKYKSKK